MKITDQGVLKPSWLDFTIPSEFAKSSLYYMNHCGHFYCNQDYSVARSALDSLLFIYVCSGTLFLETGGKKYEASANQIALLDCRSPHHYYCRDRVEFLFFHFSGNNSSAYAAYLAEQKGIVFTGSVAPKLKSTFTEILAGARAIIPNEHYISLCIATLFSHLAAPATPSLPSNHVLNPAIREINEHYDTDINLEDLAALCSISTSHFIRSFKSSLGYTPHEYLLAYRLRRSKQLLLSSAATIEEIAEQCGFHSASHYARAFRQAENMSPTEFRSMHF